MTDNQTPITGCIHLIGMVRCRRRARFFGRWAGGGLCLSHALEAAREHGIDQFHADSRTELERAVDESSGLMTGSRPMMAPSTAGADAGREKSCA